MAKKPAKPKAKAPAKPKEPEFDAALLKDLAKPDMRNAALKALEVLLLDNDPKATIWYLERMVGKPHTNESPAKTQAPPALVFNLGPGTTLQGMFAAPDGPTKRE